MSSERNELLIATLAELLAHNATMHGWETVLIAIRRAGEETCSTTVTAGADAMLVAFGCVTANPDRRS